MSSESYIGPPRGTPPPLDLRAVEARLRRITPGQIAAFGAGEGLPVRPDPTREEYFALLAHCRALREVVELGRITLTDNHVFPGKSFDWYRAQAMYLQRAAAVLAEASDAD